VHINFLLHTNSVGAHILKKINYEPQKQTRTGIRTPGTQEIAKKGSNFFLSLVVEFHGFSGAGLRLQPKLKSRRLYLPPASRSAAG
jgi:hypothetical protein